MVIEDLWGQIFRGATKSTSCFAITNFFFAQPKIGNFNVTVFVEEKIGKLVIGLKMADFNQWKIAGGNANLRLVVTLLMSPTIMQGRKITNRR